MTLQNFRPYFGRFWGLTGQGSYKVSGKFFNVFGYLIRIATQYHVKISGVWGPTEAISVSPVGKTSQKSSIVKRKLPVFTLICRKSYCFLGSSVVESFQK
jgi:hypothetical protein